MISDNETEFLGFGRYHGNTNNKAAAVGSVYRHSEPVIKKGHHKLQINFGPRGLIRDITPLLKANAMENPNTEYRKPQRRRARKPAKQNDKDETSSLPQKHPSKPVIRRKRNSTDKTAAAATKNFGKATPEEPPSFVRVRPIETLMKPALLAKMRRTKRKAAYDNRHGVRKNYANSTSDGSMYNNNNNAHHVNVITHGPNMNTGYNMSSRTMNDRNCMGSPNNNVYNTTTDQNYDFPIDMRISTLNRIMNQGQAGYATHHPTIQQFGQRMTLTRREMHAKNFRDEIPGRKSKIIIPVLNESYTQN